MQLKVPYYKQEKFYSCGPAALRIVYAYHGKQMPEWELVEATRTPKSIGTDNHMMVKAPRQHGFKVWSGKSLKIEDIKKFVDKEIPVVVNYVEMGEDIGHYAVVVGYDDKSLILNDPEHGAGYKISFKEFLPRWHDHANTKPYRRWAVVIYKDAKRAKN